VSPGEGAGHGSILPRVLGAVLTAMVTPFDADGRVDEPATAALARHLLDNGSDGLVMAGTTGEASTLDDDEKVALYRLAVREAGGRASVVAGTGSNDTAHSVHLTARAAEAGVDAVLVVTPYYNRPPRAGIVAHVAAIAEVGVPVVLYNIPSRTGLNMEPDLIAELGTIPNVTAVKQANPDLGELTAVAESSGLALYAGNDDMLLPVLERGGAGVISVASHLVGPEMAAIVEAAGRGDMEDARRRDAALQGVNAGLFVTTNPILVKAALEMLGLIPSARLRLPLVEATPVQRDILRTVLEHQGILARA
jgi:4-hydroxy-tetrahydrodipicolinate synthase